MEQPVLKKKEQFTMIGLSVKTTNANEMTADAKIGGLWGQYYGQKVYEAIPNPVTPAVTYGLYSDYVDGVNGTYDITAGLAVTNFDACPEGLVVKHIPAATYLVFTSDKGPVSKVVIELWQQIWRYFEQQNITRTFTGDFERYDERCADPQNAQVDVYIAIRQEG